MVNPFPVFIAGLITVSLAVEISAQPTAELTANGASGSVTLTDPRSLTLTVGLAADSHTGQSTDWWLVNRTPDAGSRLFMVERVWAGTSTTMPWWCTCGG